MRAVDRDKLKQGLIPQGKEIELPGDMEFEPCVKCKDLTETDFIDRFGRCPTCGIASPLRLVK